MIDEEEQCNGGGLRMADVGWRDDASLQKYLFRQRASLFCSDKKAMLATYVGLQEMAREGLENVECVTNICTHVREHCYPGDLI